MIVVVTIVAGLLWVCLLLAMGKIRELHRRVRELEDDRTNIFGRLCRLEEIERHRNGDGHLTHPHIDLSP